LDAPGKSLWHRLEPTILGSGAILILLLLWEVLPRIITMKAGTKLFFTTPSQIIGTLWRLFSTGAIWTPLGVSASGFALGVRHADRTLINVVRAFGASEWDVARLVVVPNAMPYIIAGLRLAIGRAVLGVVVAEFFGSESGLGVMMVQAAGRYQVDVVFSGLIVFAVLSLALTWMVQLLENRLSRWRPQRSGGE